MITGKRIINVDYIKVDDTLPAFKAGTKHSAGIDLYATEDTWIMPNRVTKVPVNLCVELPTGFFGWVNSRSGMSSKGVVVIPGIVDSDYRGQIKAIVHRVGLLPKKIKKGERIAQMMIMNYDSIRYTEVDELSETERGNKGFGSTGTK